MADSLVTLYQAEWCPFSSAVREVLTELGIDAVIRQVEPWPEQRNDSVSSPEPIRSPSCRPRTARILRGTREIFAHLREREPWRYAAAHRRRFADHRDARESDAAGKLLEYFADAGDLESREPRAAPAGDAEVVNVPQAHRYELLLDGQRIGELAYRQRNDRMAFTHTNVDAAYEGRGFGSRLAEAALADARRQGLAVVPLCPFIAWYIEQHPEHGDLVPADYAGRRDAS